MGRQEGRELLLRPYSTVLQQRWRFEGSLRSATHASTLVGRRAAVVLRLFDRQLGLRKAPSRHCGTTETVCVIIIKLLYCVLM